MGECLITRRGGEAYELPILNSAYPANVTVVEAANASASFNVQIATPGKPAEYTYQWYLNGAKISGATNSSYTKTGLTAAGTHTLYCVVTNKAGTVTSRVATLTVANSKPTYTYTGSHQMIDEGGYNWRIKFLSSGTLKFTNLGSGTNGIDVFLVGGGGSGGTGGGGGGYTKKSVVTSVRATAYSIVVGAGGAIGSDYRKGVNGGNSSAFGVTASGGKGGNNWYDSNSNGNGGAGGSGGGGFGGDSAPGGGGLNGGNGRDGVRGAGGAGQGTTTGEFGVASATRYGGGGMGAGAYNDSNHSTAEGGGSRCQNGVTNRGGGGGGYAVNSNTTTGKGGSGIVIIRNKR